MSSSVIRLRPHKGKCDKERSRAETAPVGLSSTYIEQFQLSEITLTLLDYAVRLVWKTLTVTYLFD